MTPSIRLLFADNDRSFLDTRAEFLENAGYHVVKAYSADEAREILRNSRVHLAFIDIRLENDDDEWDVSGLLLAKDPANRSVPKIILTGFPTFQHVREALGSALDLLPFAVDFLAKQEGPEVMMRAVERAVASRVHVNWQLAIRWSQGPSIVHLAELIDPDLDTSSLPDRAGEIDDLLRKLFYNYTQITIDRLLASENGRVLLEVIAHDATGRDTQVVVSCGVRQAIANENAHHEEFVPNGQGDGGTVRGDMAETMHFAATAYTLVGCDLEDVASFESYYQTRPVEPVDDALDNLYRTTLAPWHKKGRYRVEGQSLDQLYLAWLGLAAKSFTSAEMERQVKAICEQSLAAGLPQIAFSSHGLVLHLSSGSPTQYLNPVRNFFENQRFPSHPALCGIIHGRVNGNTVLLDQDGHTWLIDFSQAGRGPLLCDFLSLEMAVKLDLLEVFSIEERYNLERALLSGVRLDEAATATDLSPEVSKALAVASHIRRLAAGIVGPEQEPYLLGLFYCAVSRIATFDPTVRHTRRELVPFVHSLLLAAMTGEKLAGVPPVSDQAPAEAQAGLWIDPASQEIWVEGKRIDDLTPQDVAILSYLYARAGSLCTRKDVVSDALQEGYSAGDQEHSRLDSAISRLRRKIEPDPENPKYLVTIRGRGYRLTL